ncbi:thermonuclease family protein [Spartinivicinus ruber]|uniref:thermonuclease family protein n=1 Tax=Spartinivicinus ruber TaxID=2683272 RepID=UPI0013D34BD2|nr:thermonuclease family protein [Spartinivicinus ruber]
MHFSSKKALLISAFFVVQIFSASWAKNSCQLKGPWHSATLAKVLDGDTLLLSDGEKVRLIGVNTPEQSTDNRPAELFANQATQQAKAFFNGQHAIKLQRGKQPKDHYGRTLAYVARSDGKLLSEFLVAQGAAFYLAIPPNLELLSCLIKIEQQARHQRSGLWHHYNSADSININKSGFSLVTGRVEKVSHSANGIWVDLVGELVLFIPKASKKYFSGSTLKQAQGRLIEVRGWLIDRRAKGRKLKRGRKRWMMKVFHPAAIIFK